jgi:hypothetical protein
MNPTRDMVAATGGLAGVGSTGYTVAATGGLAGDGSTGDMAAATGGLAGDGSTGDIGTATGGLVSRSHSWQSCRTVAQPLEGCEQLPSASLLSHD